MNSARANGILKLTASCIMVIWIKWGASRKHDCEVLFLFGTLGKIIDSFFEIGVVFF